MSSFLFRRGYRPDYPSLFARWEPPIPVAVPALPERQGKKCRPRVRGKAAKDRWNDSRRTDGEAAAELVRGVLAKRFDDFMMGPIRDRVLECGVGERVFFLIAGDMYGIMFPEMFGDSDERDDFAAAEIRDGKRHPPKAKGLVPTGGLERVSVEHLREFAARLATTDEEDSE